MKIKYNISAKHLYLIGLVAIFFGLGASLVFTLSRGNQPWFESLISIDGRSYLKGMLSIARQNDFLNLEDIYHSPGYQMYLGLIYKFYPNDDRIFLVVKIISWIMNFVCVGLVFYLGKRYFSQYAGLCAAILFAWSNKYRVYINLLQPEVLLGFLVLWYVFFQVRALEAESRDKQLFLIFISGILSLAICLIQVRYICLLPFGCLSIYLRQRARARNEKPAHDNVLSSILVFILPFILIFGAWSLYHSLARRTLIIGQDGSPWRFLVGNNPNAIGWSFPYPEIGSPAGLQFIALYPGKFLWLVKQRFLFLWDLKKDIWYLKNPVIEWLNTHLGNNTFDLPFYGLSFLAFFAGFLVKIKSDLNSSLISVTSPFYLTFLASIIAPLVIFSSSRFLVPSIPIIVLFQAYFIIWLFQRLKTAFL
ncbi:MAG: glycosyltransferase family 39 protein [Candidatus Omnitrophota bacterium]